MSNDVTLSVSGLTGLTKAFKLIDKNLSKELRTSLRLAAEPVRSNAEARAMEAIPKIGVWGRMRTGVTQRVVYVAPRQRGRASRTNRSLRRPNLANLLLDRSMVPALEQNIPQVERRINEMLTELGREWEQVPLG